MGNSLRWEALWYVDWISVNDETDGYAEGMGDGTAHIGVTHAKSRTDDTATTVTFIYYDEDTGEEVGRKTVNVCRCVICNCDSFDILGYKMCSCSYFEIDTSTLTFAWDADEETPPEVVYFITDEECIADIKAEVDNEEWFSAIVNQNNITVYSKKKNKNTDQITGVITISYESDGKPCDDKKIKLIKEGKPCNCSNFEILGYDSCSCNNLTIEKTKVEWDWDNISPGEVGFEITDDCVGTDSIATSNTNSHFSVEVDTDNNKVIITPNSKNEQHENSASTVTISYVSGQNQRCSSAITAIHYGKECECETDFNFTSSANLVWKWNEKSYSSVTFTASTCVSNISTSNGTYFSSSISDSENKVVVSPIPDPDGVLIEEDLTVTYNVAGKSEPCRKTIHAKRESNECGCSKFELDDTSITWAWDSQEPSSITFTTDECIKNIVSAETSDEKVKNHFTVAISENKITVTPNGKNTTEEDISGNLNISYSSDLKPNCVSSITLSHLNSNCKCDDLIIDKTELNEWDWNDKTTEQYINIDASNTCIPFESLSTGITGTNKNDFIISSAFTEEYKIKLTVLPKDFNTSTTDNLIADIVITYESGSKPSCTKKISLIHKKMICDCDNFKIIGYE